MNAGQAKRISKLFSYVLRHHPSSMGITLDEAGWVEVDVFLAALQKHGHRVSGEQLVEVVQTNDKQRFALSDDGARIRASQGHSVAVDLGYSPAEPPAVLYHGTVKQFLDSIRREGLEKGQRHHVHLSPTLKTATNVGARRGKPVVLTVNTSEMAAEGFEFFVTPNEVWLVDSVPPQFIEFPAKSS